MSRRSYTRHIPDFRLVTFLAENGRSAAHMMSPWTKGVLLVMVILLVIVLTDLYLLLIMFGVVLGFYIIGRLPIRLLLGWYSLPVLFVVTLSIMFMFTEPGTVIAGTRFLGIHIALTDNGVLLFVKLLVRALVVVTFSFAVFMTTRYSYIAHIASRTLPRTLANIFLLSYRFTFETSDEMSDVIDALHARSGNLAKGASKQTRMFAGIFGLAFVHAFERAERIAKAMEARGFTGEFPRYEKLPQPRPGGFALIALAVLAFGIVSYSRYVNDLLVW
jgi:cobalt/nickel transport system permease protein